MYYKLPELKRLKIALRCSKGDVEFVKRLNVWNIQMNKIKSNKIKLYFGTTILHSTWANKKRSIPYITHTQHTRPRYVNNWRKCGRIYRERTTCLLHIRRNDMSLEYRYKTYLTYFTKIYSMKLHCKHVLNFPVIKAKVILYYIMAIYNCCFL